MGKKNRSAYFSRAVFAFKAIEDKKGTSYYFEKLWAKSFPGQTGVVNLK